MRRPSGEKRSGFIPQLPVGAFHWGQQKGWCRWQPAGDKGGGCSLSNPPTLSTSRWEERKLVEQVTDTAVSGGLRTGGRGLASLKGPWCPRASQMPGTFMVLQRPLAKEWPSGVQVLPVLRWGQKRVRMGALARGGSREGTRVAPGTTRWPPHTPIKPCITEKLGSPSQPPNSLLPGLAFQTSTLSPRSTRVGTQGHPKISHLFQLLFAKYLLNVYSTVGATFRRTMGSTGGAHTSLAISSSAQTAGRAPRPAEWRPLPSSDSRGVMWIWGKAPSLILAFIPTTLSRAPTSSAFSILGQAQSLCEQVPPRLAPPYTVPQTSGTQSR